MIQMNRVKKNTDHGSIDATAPATYLAEQASATADVENPEAGQRQAPAGIVRLRPVASRRVCGHLLSQGDVFANEI